jgi:hypothetical protein
LDGGQVVLSLMRMAGNESRARSFTLGLTLVTACTGVAYLIGTSNGRLPTFTIALALILVFTAFRDLRP